MLYLLRLETTRFETMQIHVKAFEKVLYTIQHQKITERLDALTGSVNMTEFRAALNELNDFNGDSVNVAYFLASMFKAVSAYLKVLFKHLDPFIRE